MNDKFFDLKKEKQDRMINAALKIFALKGYEHASTDDIVREAGISKGLLFHYFISKIGLYAFVYDYSVKYMMLEYSTGISKEETDFFALISQMKNCELQVMRNYPYMLQFLNESKKEDVKEALVATEEKAGVLPEHFHQIMQRTDLGKFRPEVDVEKLVKIIKLTSNGLMTEQLISESFQAELYVAEIEKYLTMLKKITYRES